MALRPSTQSLCYLARLTECRGREAFSTLFADFRFQGHIAPNAPTLTQLHERAFSGAGVKFDYMPNVLISNLDETYVSMMWLLPPHPCRVVPSVLISIRPQRQYLKLPVVVFWPFTISSFLGWSASVSYLSTLANFLYLYRAGRWALLTNDN